MYSKIIQVVKENKKSQMNELQNDFQPEHAEDISYV